VNVAAPADSGGNSLLPLLLLVGLFALMYFMVIRPQSQRRKQMQEMQDSIAVGSQIITIGGLYGTVVDIDKETVTLEVSPGQTNKYARAAIGKVLPPEEAEAADEPDADTASGNTADGTDKG
jgi:preprotein translocase subunit YajC